MEAISLPDATHYIGTHNAPRYKPIFSVSHLFLTFIEIVVTIREGNSVNLAANFAPKSKPDKFLLNVIHVGKRGCRLGQFSIINTCNMPMYR
jgi:hypothetical protein